MILLDWTRMGRSYCLAGAVKQNEQRQFIELATRLIDQIYK